MDKNISNIKESQRIRTQGAWVYQNMASRFGKRFLASCPQDSPRPLWFGGRQPNGCFRAAGPEGALLSTIEPESCKCVVPNVLQIMDSDSAVERNT
jgi:hypothetical protein